MCLTSAQREKIVSIVSLPCVSAGQKDTPDGSAAEIGTRDGGVEDDGNQSFHALASAQGKGTHATAVNPYTRPCTPHA